MYRRAGLIIACLALAGAAQPIAGRQAGDLPALLREATAALGLSRDDAPPASAVGSRWITLGLRN